MKIFERSEPKWIYVIVRKRFSNPREIVTSYACGSDFNRARRVKREAQKTLPPDKYEIKIENLTAQEYGKLMSGG